MGWGGGGEKGVLGRKRYLREEKRERCALSATIWSGDTSPNSKLVRIYK